MSTFLSNKFLKYRGLAHKPVPIETDRYCQGCGYNVRGLVFGRNCPECGTHLFSASEARPHLVIVRNGTLDDTALLKPGAIIWTASASEWAWIDESIPRHAGQPPPA